jgi:hypothetical protein
MSGAVITLNPDKNPLLKSISTCNAHVSVQDELAVLHDNKWNGALSNRVIDGFIFGYEISKLINFIKSYYPSIKAMNAGDKRWLDEGGWMYHGAYLYYDDCPITVGRIAYSPGEGKAFHFRSARVTNERYIKSKWRSDSRYYQIDSDDPFKLAKRVSAYCVRFTLDVVAFKYYEVIRNCSRDAIYTAARGAEQLVSPLRDADVLQREIENLVSQGVKFVTPEFNKFVEEFQEAKQAKIHEAHRSVPVYLVRVTTWGGVQHAELLSVQNVREHERPVPVATDPLVRLPMTDLPEDIVGKLSVLMVLGVGEHLNTVGMRISENYFWIER